MRLAEGAALLLERAWDAHLQQPPHSLPGRGPTTLQSGVHSTKLRALPGVSLSSDQLVLQVEQGPHAGLWSLPAFSYMAFMPYPPVMALCISGT